MKSRKPYVDEPFHVGVFLHKSHAPHTFYIQNNTINSCVN